MKKPVFSIITCTYNAESTLERTIKSVEGQSYTSVEHLIIDGASTDGSIRIASLSSKAKVLSEPDGGLYDAMNKGIRMATGDYLIFLNAGDKFHDKDTLSNVASMISGEEDIIYGETSVVDDNGDFLYMRRLKSPERLDWKSFKKGMLICHQAFWVKGNLAKKIPYNLKYRYSSDVDWCIRVLKESKYILNTGSTLIDYLEEGMTTTHHKASLMERFQIMSTHYGMVPTIFHHCFFLIRALFSSSRRKAQ